MDFILMLVMTALMRRTFCHPPPEDINVPVPLSSPAEINNLHFDPKNINEHRDVAPLTQFNSAVNLDATIQEVEDLIKANPKLPRLTRGEIIDILENLTRTDIAKVKISNKTRVDGQRAVMLVMPYTAGSAQGDIKDLYTRPPVTHMVGVEVPQAESKPRKKTVRRKPPSFPKIQMVEEESNSIFGQSAAESLHVAEPLPISTPQLSSPTSLTPTAHNLTPPEITSTKPPTTQTIKSVATTKSEFPHKLRPTRKHQVYTQKYPNHRYPDDELVTAVSESGIRIIAPPILSPYDDINSMPYTINIHDLKNEQNPGPTFASKIPQTMQTTIINDMPIPEDFKTVVKDLDVLIEPNFKPIESDVSKPSILNPMAVYIPQTTTTIKPIPDITEFADNLSPDMRDLLMNFGLLENANKKPEVIQEEMGIYGQKAVVKPESYLSFRPLPDNAPVSDGMDDFLSKFGLGKNTGRSQKSIAMDKPRKELEKNPQLVVAVTPKPVRGVMQDLGFTTKNVKFVNADNHITEAPTHIFNPTSQNSTEEELGRLSKLLNMIKYLDKTNNNITEENLKNIDVNTLKELIGSFNGDAFVPLDEQDAPNPIHYDYKVVKSGSKRQEENTAAPTTTTTTSTTTATPTTTTTTTTESARSPSFEDLEASFGGLPSVDPTTTEPPTTTRRSGFYYLLDWNTFFDIDDQNGKRVNLRLQPKVGDPKNFRYVTVP